MEKAYDFKELVNGLKGRGLDLAEDAGLIILEEVSEWVVKSAALSSTPFDDIAAVVMPTLKKEAMKLIDKIDGQEG